jgi:hypothetical protein
MNTSENKRDIIEEKAEVKKANTMKEVLEGIKIGFLVLIFVVIPICFVGKCSYEEGQIREQNEVRVIGKLQPRQKGDSIQGFSLDSYIQPEQKIKVVIKSPLDMMNYVIGSIPFTRVRFTEGKDFTVIMTSHTFAVRMMDGDTTSIIKSLPGDIKRQRYSDAMFEIKMPLKEVQNYIMIDE